jgi:hypothetical protein
MHLDTRRVGCPEDLAVSRSGESLSIPGQAVYGVTIDSAPAVVQIREQLSDHERPAALPPNVHGTVNVPLLQRIGPPEDGGRIKAELDIARLKDEAIGVLGIRLIERVPGFHGLLIRT